MIRLFADTSSDYLSLLLKADDKTLSFIRLSCGRRMSELIFSAIDNIFISSGVSLKDVGELYAITGPGSFTGVRIGVAAFLGLGSGASIPVYGLSSLDMAAISSHRPLVKAACRLKGNIFAVRSYDFTNSDFSPYYTENIDEISLAEYTLVNTDNNFFIDIEKSVAGDKFLAFRGDCVPLYLRKSEAEINVDKKSGIQ